jgi:hypothetical protein
MKSEMLLYTARMRPRTLQGAMQYTAALAVEAFEAPYADWKLIPIEDAAFKSLILGPFITEVRVYLSYRLMHRLRQIVSQNGMNFTVWQNSFFEGFCAVAEGQDLHHCLYTHRRDRYGLSVLKKSKVRQQSSPLRLYLKDSLVERLKPILEAHTIELSDLCRVLLESFLELYEAGHSRPIGEREALHGS